MPEDAVGLTWKFSDGVTGAAFDLTGIGLLQASIETDEVTSTPTPAPTAPTVEVTPTPTPTPTPAPVSPFVSVSAGGYHTCGLRSDGSVACWGDNGAAQTRAHAGTFVSVSAGGSPHLRCEERPLRRLLGQQYRVRRIRWPSHAARGYLRLRQRRGDPHLRGEEQRLRRLLGLG